MTNHFIKEEEETNKNIFWFKLWRCLSPLKLLFQVIL